MDAEEGQDRRQTRRRLRRAGILHFLFQRCCRLSGFFGVSLADADRQRVDARARQGFGDFDAVDGGGEDAAGVARAFAGGVEAARVQALEVFAAADRDGR